MKKSKLLEILNGIAPLDLQENWDNSGMQLDFGRDEINRVLVALEITKSVIEEAKEKGCDMIVTHHPLLFYPVKRICPDLGTGSYILSLMEDKTEVYSAHTCFDSADGGNNDYIMELFGVPKVYRLPIPGQPVSDWRMAKLGEYLYPVSFSEFCEKLAKALNYPGAIKVAGDPGRMVKKIAVCTGAGGEFLSSAVMAGADVFVSGDIKHHEAQQAKELGMCLVDAGHFGTEWIFAPNMAEKLRALCGAELEVIETKSRLNPYDRVL